MDRENPIFRSLEIIEKKIHEKLTVESLAESVHFSKYHYQRMFQEAVGESVMQYVARRRITLAARELTEMNTNILEIALKYGYDSHEGFTRSFRTYGHNSCGIQKILPCHILPTHQKGEINHVHF